MVLPHVWSDGPLLPYMEHVSYGPTHMYVWSPHMYNMMVPFT